MSNIPRFIDIGVNLTDPVFRGIHRGSRKHDDDLFEVMKRSKKAGVKSMILTGGSLKESKEALKLATELDLYATIGCHPTRSYEFDQHPRGPDAYLAELDKLIASHLKGKGRVVAIGECGLDYDRLHFAPEETQRKHFRSQLALAKKYSLPLFLHSRAAHVDLVKILTEEGFAENGGRSVGARGGVVHSFTGTLEEMKELAAMGFHFSINGCGLKTAENLAVASSIPLDKLMLETDAPWCTITSTHVSHSHLSTLPTGLSPLYLPASTRPERFVKGSPVKGRNEPILIGAVAWVLASLRAAQLNPEESGNEGRKKAMLDITEAAWKNTVDVFGLADLREFVSEDPKAETAPPAKPPPPPKAQGGDADWPTLG